MKAIVLCAGEGTRLRPISFTGPKHLIPIANKPIVIHIIESIAETGIGEIGLIINRGKLVATDSVDNLTRRLRGSEAVAVEVESRDGAIDAAQVQQRLEQVPGVSRVIARDSQARQCGFEVESLQGRSIRAALARAVIEGGWDLIELKPVAFSLEEVFLQLTSSEGQPSEGGAE